MTTNENPISPSEEFELRKQQALQLKADGKVVYKDRFEKTHSAAEVTRQFTPANSRNFEDIVVNPQNTVRTAGRIMSWRDHGKIVFANIQDQSGEIQVALKADVLGDAFAELVATVQIGDFIGVVGEPFYTKQGKLAVLATSAELLSKTLRPLPSEHFGIEDIETKWRKRYLDTLLDKDAHERFIIRSKAVQALRSWLLEHNFLELTTRTLQPVAGGAMAENFKTHHNALDYDFQLRISPELDLKMMVAGGYDRVFEFAICFRNEGMDPSHVQEFQMLEWYAAYENYETGMQWTEEMLRETIEKALGTLEFKIYDKEGAEHTIDFSKPIPRKKFADLLKEYANVDMIETPQAELVEKAVELGIDRSEAEKRSRGNLLDDIYKKTARPHLIQPVFVTHYPVEIVPLARPMDSDPRIAESYQLLIGSWEVVKAYSELVDPFLQRQKFEDQAKAREAGDKEAMEINTEFLTAMEHGMPPITGWGMGIERFVTLITGQKNLRDTVFFPTMRPDNTNN